MKINTGPTSHPSHGPVEDTGPSLSCLLMMHTYLGLQERNKKKKKEVGLQEVRSGWRESRICTLIQLKALGQTGKQACPVISLSLRSHTCTAEGQASTEVRGRRWAWVGTGVGTCTARSKDHKSCISVSCAYGISKGLLPTTCGAPTLLSSKSKF